jgi:hypothetical protein
MPYPTHVSIPKNQPGVPNLYSNGFSIRTSDNTTYVLTGVYSDGDNWDCEIDNLNSNYLGGTQTMTLTWLDYEPTNIWTKTDFGFERGKFATTGSNTFVGNQTISGSLNVTGSVYADNLVGLVSSSAQITEFGFVSSSTAIPAGTISGSAQITTLGFVSGSYETTGKGIISGSSQLTSAFPSKTIGTWILPVGASTQSFTVDPNSSYTMWVNGNIPNGIITWNATATISNTNVPVLGAQYAWYYTTGNALVLTTIPDQFVGTNGSIATTPNSYAPNTSNVFKFGITNNSATTQSLNYGYIKLS